MEKINYELFDEQLDRYLRHQMTAEEVKKFRFLLASNPELKARAKVIALMIKEMMIVGISQEQPHEQPQEQSQFQPHPQPFGATIHCANNPHPEEQRQSCRNGREPLENDNDRQIIAEIAAMEEAEYRREAGLEPKREPKTKARRLWPRIMTYAAAACLLLFVFVGSYNYYEYRQTVSLGESQYELYNQDIAADVSMRGTHDNAVVDHLMILFANVRTGRNLKETISQLEPLYKEAFSADSEYYEFDNDITWNLAIAYLKTGDRRKPLPLLERMVEMNRNRQDIWQPAQNLIDRIKAL